MKMNKVIGLISRGAAIAGILFFLAGCAAEKNPPFGAAELVSDPPGADVINVQDNSTLGTTPFKYVRETSAGEDEYTVVKVTKPGYADEIVSFFLKAGFDDEEAAKENPQQIEIKLMEKK
jgi:hypothetical protein